jgi:CDP-diacylglycerol--glycerol-3-phosphate 3-phosphatidyltransferase
MVSYTRARAEALGANCKTGLATRAERVVLIGAGLLFNLLAPAITLLAILATVTTVQRLLSVRSRLSDLEETSAE